ncbi:hypothetical protein [Microbacterium sp. Marseille-Q6965]|uniref:beta-xylosidase family glycoside hydrolase n=1 Tax=Microbacterium sp. Marseille-Q6965 TaxID=2965072 RepID=UPI0021B75653|nr:hypothetical protein [Microbacterium sp. Marseille-Q6965]
MSLSFAPEANTQHAGIVLYGHDDEYIELTRAYNSWVGGHAIALIDESGGRATDLPRLPSNATELVLRLQRDAGTHTIVASVSTDDGSTWTQVGTVARDISGARLAINVAGSSGVGPMATIHEARITTD